MLKQMICIKTNSLFLIFSLFDFRSKNRKNIISFPAIVYLIESVDMTFAVALFHTIFMSKIDDEKIDAFLIRFSQVEIADCNEI